jgi:heavy metal sensor kinase
MLLRWLPAALLVAALATWWLAGFALAPVLTVAAAARKIDVSNLSLRLPVRGAGDELDHMTETFNETLRRLEHAVGDMRQFSSALAHELRTPLAALRGEIELDLRRTGSNDSRGDALASQLEEIDRLTRLIDQILTLARAESGQIPFAPRPVDLAALSTTLVEQLVPIAETRAVKLNSEGAGPVVVDGDAGWIQRLMMNLVDNAIKFTPSGGHVVLRVRPAPGGAEIEVQDTGVGISAADAPNIFERFYRVDPARSSESPGAGLGLTLVKWIVDGHHGRIRVESQPGNGTRVVVWLPAWWPKSAPTSPVS